MHRSVAEETACSRDGRMRRVHSRMRIAPISQESEGYSGTILKRSNYAGTGSTRPVSAMAANEEHTREAAQSEPRMNREEHIPSEPSGAVPVVAGTNPEQESRSDRPPADIQQLDSGQGGIRPSLRWWRDMGFRAVTTICREKMTFMFSRHRFVVLI